MSEVILGHADVSRGGHVGSCLITLRLGRLEVLPRQIHCYHELQRGVGGFADNAAGPIDRHSGVARLVLVEYLIFIVYSQEGISMSRGVKAIAGPAIFFWPIHDTCPHRIELDVPAIRENVPLCTHQARLKPSHP